MKIFFFLAKLYSFFSISHILSESILWKRRSRREEFELTSLRICTRYIERSRKIVVLMFLTGRERWSYFSSSLPNSAASFCCQAVATGATGDEGAPVIEEEDEAKLLFMVADNDNEETSKRSAAAPAAQFGEAKAMAIKVRKTWGKVNNCATFIIFAVCLLLCMRARCPEISKATSACV